MMCANAARASEDIETCVEAPEACEEIVLVENILVSEPRLTPAAAGQALVRLKGSDFDGIRVDGLLATVPGVGLFRRADSLSAHPTTQGLTMRGVGANGAGRVLVTLDGVPLNDPFGGWVYWSALDAHDLGEVEVRSGGSPGAFGAQALAGTVDLKSRYVRETGLSARASYGSFDTADLAATADLVVEDTAFTLSGGHFESDGFYLLSKDQRGPADVPAASDMDRLRLRAGHWFADASRLSGAIRWYRESRVNGSAPAVNDSEALDLSLRLQRQGNVGYEVAAYYHDGSFSNIFASVDADRTAATPVLDQYDVPAKGAGFLARIQFDGIELGLDARHMSGETNERFRNLGAGFTRDRQAGGQQWTAGLYAEIDQPFARGDGTLAATFRLDRWRSYDGIRLETDVASNAVVREDAVPDRDGTVPTGRLGVDYALTPAITLRGAAYKSWRLPTINEYYRPFRVGNDITEANPDLGPEKLYGIEAGLDYQPIYSLKLSATLYRNWLQDGVGNITIGEGPGFFPLGGFVPAGGVLRQRANIDESITDGFEFGGEIELNNGWHLKGRYLYARARITGFDAMPELVGKRPSQTPRHSLTGSVHYEVWDSWSAELSGRYQGAQYDDDQNQRRLGDVFTLGLSAAFKVSDAVRLTARADNLFDAKVVSALSADGLETLARRRFVRVGLEASF